MCLLEALRPEMIIVDDIDRVGEVALTGKLPLFEERHCEVPLVLFTSNDHTRLPAALRRPGRIDQIIEVDEPDDGTRYAVLREKIAELGVEPPEEAMVCHRDVADGLLHGHVVEWVRRCDVLGWSTDPIPGDITFDPEAMREHEGNGRQAASSHAIHGFAAHYDDVAF